MSNQNQSFLTTLRKLLALRFDQEELRTLSFDLSIDYDDLRGEGKVGKVREIIMLMARQQRLPELVELVQKYRPNDNWPSVPEDFALEAISSSPEMDTASTSVGASPTFNISGDIKAGQVNVGGVQTITEPIDVDMRETTIVQPAGEVIMGDRIDIPGDFRGAIVNVKSRLDNVTQTINALPHGDDTQKAELTQLVNELKKQLARVPAEHAKDAERVSKRIEALAREIDSEEPDKEMVEIAGESLKRAAQNLKDVLPTVLAITTQIVVHAMRFVV